MFKSLTLMAKIGTIFLTWRRIQAKDLVPCGITLKQQFVLMELVKAEFLYPSEIADFLYCDRPTATVIIKNMESKKWVKRVKDPEDSRQYRIAVTEEGIKKLDEVRKINSSKNNENPTGVLSPEEKETLHMLLNKLGDALNIKD